MATDAETEFASAKVNLTLHVTGRQADGYHLLDSLVVFAGVGDRVSARPADALSLTVTGPRATGLTVDQDNLCLRAARLMSGKAALVLDKHLPVAAGIGGGSADAAATLRLLARQMGRDLPAPDQVLGLGADVPACLLGRPLRMTGIGGGLHVLDHPLPASWLVLVNPGQAVATAQVFKTMERRDNPPMPALPVLNSVADLAGWLGQQRNDMEPAAIRLLPAIAGVKAALAAQPGCLLARMSGSGATCFGLFAAEEAAKAAARALMRQQPGWWVAAAPILP